MCPLSMIQADYESLQSTYESAYAVGSVIGMVIFLFIAIAISRGLSWLIKTVLVKFLLRDKVRLSIYIAAAVCVSLLALPALLWGAWIHGGIYLLLIMIWLYVDVQTVGKSERADELRIY